MLFEDVIKYCDETYKNRECNCNYEEYCPKKKEGNDGCGKCLVYVHFPKSAPKERNYDCIKMAEFYTCRYTYKYSSELIYAFEQLENLKDKDKIKVMSIGCGPCTDLFALEVLREEGVYKYKNVQYVGIDSEEEIWKGIHDEIVSLKKDCYNIEYKYIDAIKVIENITDNECGPDLLVFHYVFSDMEKKNTQTEIDVFIEKISKYINESMEDGAYVLLNDINYSEENKRGRGYFDDLAEKTVNARANKFHFNNSIREKHFDYGVEYQNNELRVDVDSSIKNRYDSYMTCSSAQMIIKKEKNDFKCK